VRSFIALAAVLFLVPFAVAQDDANRKATRILLDKAEEEYRTYFKRPNTAIALWAAIKFEVDVGKFDLAALHLNRLVNDEKLKADQVDEDLFKIESVEGMNSFLRLLRVERWSDHPPFQKEAEANVKLFFERLNAVVERKLSDSERINKFIKQLDAETPEERTFAFVQLNRSRERAVPYLVEKLIESQGQPLQHRIIEAMIALDPETVPAYLEVLKARDAQDAREQELRLTLLRILRKRGDARVVPYLWHLSASRMYPPQIRDTARNFLAEFLKVDKDVLPPSKLALTELSNKYFQHQVKFPEKIRFWKWDGQKISLEPVELKVADAEELFGLRYALEALELDASYIPAQLSFLNMTLERTLLRDFENSVTKPMPPAAQRLFATLDADLLLRLLDRGYEENNIPVILGAVRALGDRGETRAAKPSAFGLPQGVIRGLYYPDRRVQFQAANALLKMPVDQTPVASARTVDVLQRLATIGEAPAALVVGSSADKLGEALNAVKEAGFTPIAVKSIQYGLTRARSLGNIEAIFLMPGIMLNELPYALTQIRGDIDHGQIPVLVVAPADDVPQYQRIVARDRNVKVLSESLLGSAEEIKKQIDDIVTRLSVAKLTTDERKLIGARTLDLLHQMARNQIPGYDVRPAFENVALALNSADNAPVALEILGRFPGTAPQIKLADFVLDPTKDALRVAAARELNRHVQRNGLLVPKGQLDKLKDLYQAKETEVPLRTELAFLVGSLPTTPTRDGRLIFQYRPDVPAVPAAPPAEKKDE
jgi:hypothetical protein